LDKFHKTPHDEELYNYINMRIDEDIEDAIKSEIADIKQELLEEVGG
jgi:hypothetical protein